MKFIRASLFAVNIVFALLLLISYLSPYVTPMASKYIPILGLLYPALFTINLAFFIFWVFTKWTYSLISFCALLIGISATMRFISFNSPKVIKSENLINISSYNLAKATQVESDQERSFYGLFSDELNDDVLFLQETNKKIISELKSRVKDKEMVFFKDKNTIILSSHRVLDSGFIDFGGKNNTCVWADILFNGEKVRLYSVHLESNNVTRIADNVRSSGEIVEKQTWDRIARMMGRYNQFTKERLEQVEAIIQHAKEIDYPTIIGGDFNDVPQSYVYAQMADHYIDAFTKRGNGMGTSFNGSIPSLRIDYLFMSEHFDALNFKTRKEEFSDHYPIQAEFILRK